jgi:hypothetical protein
METKSEVTSDASAGREKLIRDGAPRYLQAVVGLREFQRVIQEACKKIVTDRLEDIASATKLSLQEEMIFEYPKLGRQTERTGWDGKSAWLAAVIPLKDVGEMYVGLFWEYRKGPDPVLLAIATLSLNNRNLFDRAWRKFGKRKDGTFHNYPWENHEVSVYETVSLDQAPSFPDRLEAILGVWLRAWSDAGGASGLVSDIPRARER